MSSKRNDWKVLKIFTVAVIAAIFGASLSKLPSAQAKAVSESTIEERLTKVREKLKQTGKQSQCEPGTLSALQNSLVADKNQTLQAQWPNYWSNWSNAPWYDWRDAPWSNWSNWRDTPWYNWSNY